MSNSHTPETVALAAEARPRKIRFNKDPWSWRTHFLGLIAAIAGLVYLVVATPAVPEKLTAMVLYGASLVLMFATSSTYHWLDLGEEGNRWLRRADHCAIFLLIAGSFLPAVVHLLDGAWRVATLATVGGMAVAGIVFKLFWLEAPRWFTAAMYVAMGWSVLVPGWRMFPLFDAAAFAWLFGGAAAYTFGAGIYASRRPDPWPGVFGFHEIWHVFVLAGAACHFGLAVHFIDAPFAPF